MRFLKDKRLWLAVLMVVFIGISIDYPVILWIKKGYRETAGYQVLKLFDPFMNFIDSGATLIMFSFSLFIAGRLLNKANIYAIGRCLFTGMITAGISVQALKHLVGRARPRLTDTFFLMGPTLKKGYDSFPSGHTTMAFSFAVIISHYLPKYRALFYIFAVIVGFERIEDGAHFPSDVLAGAILGSIVGKILLTMFEKQNDLKFME